MKYPEENISGVCEICKLIMNAVLLGDLNDIDNIAKTIEGVCNSLGFLSFICKPIIDPILDAIIKAIDSGMDLTDDVICHQLTHLC